MKGSYYDNNKLPQVGEIVYAPTVVAMPNGDYQRALVVNVFDQMTVPAVDFKYIRNGVSEFDKYHVTTEYVYDHFPQPKVVTDLFGSHCVWE